MASQASTDGAASTAIEAVGLSKGYRLGEHRSLQQTVRHLTRRSGATEGPLLDALAGVDFRIDRGETVGIVGGNGSGKSTLLQLVSGITIPTGGWLTVRGRVLPLLAVGTGFHPELTGRENVTLFGASIGIPRKLSRLSFATAVLFPADVYLFDEVLAVVDADFQRRCLDEIRQLSKAGRTVMFVSHNVEQIASTCHTVMWFESGRLRETGPTEGVLESYSRVNSVPS
jgi:ABC-type polysaccharide/polyol phosphate transport system ATPase subunit